MIHYSEVPCGFGQIGNYLYVGEEINVIVLGLGKPDRFGNLRYNLSEKSERAGNKGTGRFGY